MNSELHQKLNKISHVKIYIKDEVIVQEGETPHFIHIILRGCGKVIPSSINGVEALIDYLEADDFIGDIEYSKKSTYVHSVVACEKTHTMMIPVEYMADLLNDVDFCRFYISNLSKKLNLSSKKSKDLTTLTAKERFLHHMIAESKDSIYEVTHTYEELAKQLGISSRHLRRIINELKDEDLIDVYGKTIKLKEDF